jgi:hypothetical protein
MIGEPSKSSESTQVRVWHVFYVAGLILFAEYLAILTFLGLR